MIKDIKELNFPMKDGKQYATLTQATAVLQDMGDKTITSTVSIDGGITPDFSYDWTVEFQGEKYIMPLRKPQGAKDNTSMRYTVDLTFQHWAIYMLKHRYFFQYTSVDANTAIPDKFIVPLRLNLGGFCEYLDKVCSYWYGDRITVDFNDYKTHDNGWLYDEEPVAVDISYSKVWDVLIKLHELYGVRWQICANGDSDHYAIKIGYPASEISHIFEYGFEGGLLKIERQIQSDKIANMIMGRGGEKNLPLRYFKDVDPQNKSFPADPDWIPELKDVPFTELRGATFRSYVQGWKHAHYNGKNNRAAAYAQWAWDKGNTDTKFDPVEYVKDDESIARYGELPDALDNNDEEYPTIQGVTSDGLGRIDEVVAVEKITSDDIGEASDSAAQMQTLPSVKSETKTVAKNDYETFTLSGEFDVPAGRTANLITDGITATGKPPVGASGAHRNETYTFLNGIVKIDDSVTVTDRTTGAELSASGIPSGIYRYTITVKLQNTLEKKLAITVGCPNPKLQDASLDEKWSDTWDIWIKDMWGIARNAGETDAQYTERVWLPILGDREKNEAKVVFSDGWLSTSEDYEFKIIEVHYDPFESLDGVPSKWRLTLAKSDADLKSLGVYVPNANREAVAGDHIFFTGTELPFYPYVIKAEERIDDAKKDTLKKVGDIKPAWVVSLDKVRIHNRGEANALVESLRIGNSLRLADKRFIINEQDSGAAYETLYLQSVTYNYIEPTEKESNLLPDVEVVLSDKYETIANPVSTLQGEVSALSRQVGAISNIEQIVRAVGDKLYLRKDGIADRSMSPTEFFSLITSAGFRSGMVGGAGWGFYKDENGRWVLETDRIMAREDLSVNSLVINQVEGQGGTIVESAAQMEITRVEENAQDYKCYFDQHEGTVGNLFHVDDIAWNSRFTPENGALKSYRRRVTDVGANYIVLTKPLNGSDRPADWPDSGVNGMGEPAEGDAIVQRGNYTDANRQFIKVRDVIGGGYERYIEGLDSVNAQGTEYYFIGRQSGINKGRPRFYLGDEAGYIEWVDGKLNIKGELNILSTVGGTKIGDYVNDVAEAAANEAKAELQERIGELQNQVDGVIEAFSGYGAPTLDNFPANEWLTDAERKKHDRDIYTDITQFVDNETTPTSGQSWKWYYNSPTDYGWTKIADSEAVRALQLAQMSVVDTDIYYYQSWSNVEVPQLPAVSAGGVITNLRGWNTVSPPWVAGKYIWQSTFVRHGDGSHSFTTPTCISGKNGESGIGVDSIVEQYYLSASRAELTGGSWQTQVPQWVAGKYVWTRLEITYSDGSVVYTDPICATGADGTPYSPNLIDGTQNFAGGFNYGGACKLTDETYDGAQVAFTDSPWRSFRMKAKIEAGKTYTFSAWVRNSNVTEIRLLLKAADWPQTPSTAAISNIRGQYFEGGDAGVWRRVSSTFDCTASGTAWMAVESTAAGEFRFCGYLLQEGGAVAPHWLPSAADMLGVSPYSLHLSNEVIAIPAYADGSVSADMDYPSSEAALYKGARKITEGVTYAIASADGVSATVSAAGVITFSGIKADTATVKVSAAIGGETLYATVSLYKVRPGEAGAAATVYSLEPNVGYVTRSLGGTLSTSDVRCTVYKTTGNSPRVPTSDNVRVYCTAQPDGEEEELLFEGNGQTEYAFIPDGATSLVFELYSEGVGGSVLLDRQTVPILLDSGENVVYVRGTGGNRHADAIIQVGGQRSVLTSRGLTVATFNRSSLRRIDLRSFDLHGFTGTASGFADYMQSIPEGVIVIIASFDSWFTDTDVNSILEEFGGTAQTNYLTNDERNKRTPYALIGMRGLGGGNGLQRTEPNTASAPYAEITSTVAQGNVVGWNAAQHIDYIRDSLKNAAAEKGSFSGGLILASLLRMGQTDPDGEYRVYSGISGIVGKENAKDPAVWFGGDMVDKDDNPDNLTPAAGMFRHDGTGYLSRGVIQFLEDCIRMGGGLQIDESGITMASPSGGNALKISNSTLPFADVSAIISPEISPALTFQAQDVEIVQDKGTTQNGLTTVPKAGILRSVKWAGVRIGDFGVGDTLNAKINIMLGYSDWEEFSPSTGSGSGTGQGSVTTPAKYPLSGSFTVRIYRVSGNMVQNVYARNTAFNSANGIGTLSISSLRMTVAGTYYLDIVINKTTGMVSASGRARSVSPQTSDVTITKRLDNQFQIASDGIMGVWNNLKLLVKSGYFGVVSGAYGLRLDTSGIHVSQDGAKSWSKVNIAKII